MAGSYQRARVSRTATSVGSVFACVRQATSNGPPVQRIGTQAFGAGEAETLSAHDSRKSTKRQGKHEAATPYEAIEARLWPTTHGWSGCDLGCAKFFPAQVTVIQVPTDLSQTTKVRHDRTVVLLEVNPGTPIFTRLAGKNL